MIRFFSLMAMLGVIAIGSAVSALTVSPLNEELVSVEVSARGETRDQVLSELKDQAVLAATGRIFLTNTLVRAEELLDAYLANYGQQFVKGVEVVEDRFRGGMTELRARVYVDYAALKADLDEKRFLYTPAFRPYITLFVEETIDGQPSPEPVSRDTVESVMLRAGFKPSESVIEEPSRRTDVSASPETLHRGFIAAERRGIEILVTGRATTTLREERDIYYDRFFFYDTELELSMYRVDTRELLARTRTSGSASNRARGEAIRVAIERAAENGAARLASVYREYWPRTVLSDADFQILLTGADDDSIQIVTQHLDRLAPGTKVSLKRRYGPSAMLAISTGASRERFIEVLGELAFPALRIVGEHDRNRFEVQVSG